MHKAKSLEVLVEEAGRKITENEGGKQPMATTVAIAFGPNPENRVEIRGTYTEEGFVPETVNVWTARCEECGTAYTKKRIRTQRFCSKRCRDRWNQREWRRRRKEENS